MTLQHSLVRLPCRVVVSRQPLLLPVACSRSLVLANYLRPYHVDAPSSQRFTQARFGNQHVRPSKLNINARFSSSQTKGTSHPASPTGKEKAKRPFRLTWKVAVAALSVAAVALVYLDTQPPQPLHPDKFTRYTITSREQISPTAFILTVSPPSPSSLLRAPVQHDLFADIWARGTTWSVEIKQPQLQVARDYTPLPPPPAGGEQGSGNSLRFLIRKYDGGEVSSYLSRLGVGDEVELRGPRYGFDVRRRLGGGGAERVVFLAGGTGIAPALQVVRAVVEENCKSGGPRVDILWANRRRADCPACPGLGHPSGELGEGEAGPVVEQLAEVQRRFPGRVSVRCAVDEEGAFVQMGALAGLVVPHTGRGDGKDEAGNCWLHSQDAVAWRPATDVETEEMKKEEGGQCQCRGGKNLLFVSGPDGFVEAYAGPKRWANGMELQGPVGGVLGKLRARYPEAMKEWLILKL